MTDDHCKTIVREQLTELGVQYSSVELGQAEVPDTILGEQYQQLRLALLGAGLALPELRKALLIEQAKQAIAVRVQQPEGARKIRNSDYLSARLQCDYSYLASLFSDVTATTIEQFTIELRIERVKELLLRGELSLTQISYQLNYSSVAHLSSQFKKVTGMTPSFFKQLRTQRVVMPATENSVNLFCNSVRLPEGEKVSFVLYR